jgi:hypothetical protein
MDVTANSELIVALLVKARNQAFQQHLPRARALFQDTVKTIELASADAALQGQLAWTALACGDIAYLTRLLNTQYGGAPAIEVTQEEERKGAGERSSILCRLQKDGRLVFVLPASAASRPGGVRLLAARFIRSVPMFVTCVREKLVEEGAAILNIADAARFPSVGYCANIDGVMLVPDPDYLASSGYESFLKNLVDHPVPWAERHKIAFWRGATTGHSDGTEPSWLGLQRVKLCQVVQGEHADLFDAGISRLQLPKDDPGNDEIRNRGYMKPYVNSLDFHKYRYQIDIDGYTSAWSALFQKLATGSTVLKIGSRDGWRQWYYDKLVAWENYVPVEAEMGDLVEKTRWLIDHDEEAQRIGANGRALALSMTYDSQVRAAAETVAQWMRQADPVDGRTRKRLRRKAAKQESGSF